MFKRPPVQSVARSLDSRKAASINLVALLVSALVSAVMVVSMPLVAAAQDEADPWAGIEEMLVVGSAGGALGLLADTGSVTEFGADDLAAFGIENTSDLADFTPNLEIVQSSATTATFFIRGVGLQDFSSNATGAIAIYLDGVPLNMPTLQVAPIFDADKVDVLKGPQGTGNYRNASGGMIAIQSKRPNLNEIESNFATTQGSIYSVDAVDAYTRSYDIGVSIPVVQDLIGTRFAFKMSQTDPIYTNRCGNGVDGPSVDVCGEASRGSLDPFIPGDLNRRVGKKNVFSLRSSWLVAPDNPFDFEALASFHFSRRDQDGNFGQAVGTGSSGGTVLGSSTIPVGDSYTEPDTAAELAELRAQIGGPARDARAAAFAAFADNFARTRPLDRHPYDGDFNRNGRQRVEIMGGVLNLSADFSGIEVKSTTGLYRTESDSQNDSDFTPLTLFEVDAKNRVTQASTDVAITGELEDLALQWNVGGFFLWEDLESENFTNLAIGDNIRNFRQDSFSYGIYAGFELDFLEDFTLSAGARFNSEEKQFNLTQTSVGGFVTLVTGAEDRKVFREPTGTVKLQYRFSESVSTYLKFNHGFKPGHFNSNGVDSNPTGTTLRAIARPEVIDAFEFGVKASYWEDRFNLNAALFHYDYQDYQVFLFEDAPNGPPQLVVLNAPEARVLGLEAEMRMTPLLDYAPDAISGLELTLGFGWLESEFLDFQNSAQFQSGPDVFEVVTDYTGNPLLNSPRFTITGGVRWPLGLGKLGEIEPRWDFSWTDDLYFDPSEGVGPRRPDNTQLPDFTLGQRAYIKHNVALTYRPNVADRAVELTGWCRNVTDERFRNYAFDVSRFRGVIINFVGDPRTCGADVRFNF